MAAFSCPYCTTRLSRQDHLQRHLQRHTGLRPYDCPKCGGAFSRSDTLRRHMTTHGESAMQSYEEWVARLKRKQDTCTSCVKAEQKCDGQQPCGYCYKTKETCLYTIRRKRNRQKPLQPNSSTGSYPCRQDPTMYPSADGAPVTQHASQYLAQATTSVGDIASHPAIESQEPSLAISVQPGTCQFGDCISSSFESQTCIPNGE